jgi:hypothetical protein
MFRQLGEVELDGMVYDTNSYCLKESAGNETITWDLLVCENNYNFQRKLHYFRELNQVNCYQHNITLINLLPFSFVHIRNILISHNFCLRFR